MSTPPGQERVESSQLEVVLPGGPPRLTPGAARAVLRLLRNTDTAERAVGDEKTRQRRAA